MSYFIRLILGIVFIYAGISRQEIFYRIREVRFKGIGVMLARIVYISAGILLIIL